MTFTNSGTDKTRVARFRESRRNWLRITTIRIIVQTVMFAMFLSFVLLTTFANLDRFPGLRLWVSKILEVDPLVAVSTAITTHTVYKGLLWSLVILIPTVFLGRIFCNWICPYGILHQFVGWLFRKLRPRETIEVNRYRNIYQVKYLVLVGMLVAAVFGSLQIGLLDPICLVYRSFTVALLPAMNMPAQGILGDYRLHQGGLLIGTLIFGLLAMNLIIPRFFCRMLCPLGAMLGVLSRFAWWRIERDPKKCTDCGLCLRNCEGACDPHKDLRMSECLVCFNCIEDCPEGALSFAFMPSRNHEVTNPEVSRRKLIFAAIVGVFFYPFARASGKSTRDFSAKAIRPPGAVEELEFLERCVKCGQCIRVCPTNTLQPAQLEAGLEGLWTPIMNFRMGHCQFHCTACGHVCPTGAIQRISIEEKLGLGEFAQQGPIKLGTAHFDTGRCLPYSKNIPCVVCEEVCPTSPKAIYTERQMRTVRDGRKAAVASTASTVTVSDWPKPGDVVGEPVVFEPDQFIGDETTSYHVLVRHADGITETQQIVGNNVDTLRIAGQFVHPPERGAMVVLKLEYKVPKVDTAFCIGCGLCERECPVVGDRRAVYVTSEGETRSQDYGERDRNRSLRLMKTGPGPATKRLGQGADP
ncbi:MAG: 4Fe-4S dicluster domain-containing protein [Phycisphaerae bacterium]|nr:4Fe-4S dicluster domain-containing protein [Phycisphaerae bacterium]